MANIKKAIADAESGNTVAFATGKVQYLFCLNIRTPYHGPFGITLKIVNEKLRSEFSI